jgi:large subunit ribosomal protein L30e
LAISFVDLERQLKSAVKTGKVTVGRKEVANTLKGSKLVVWSGAANLSQDLLTQCQSLEIPAVRYDGNPIELGRMAGIPFKVSVLSVKTIGDAKLDPFSSSKDYSVKRLPSFMTPAPAAEETEEEAPEEKTKKAKKETKRRAKKEEAGEKEEKPKSRKTSRAKEESEDKETKTKTAKPKSTRTKAKKDEGKKKKATKKAESDDEEE